MVKNPPASAGDIRDADSIPGLERSPGGGNGNPLQYFCLEKPTDRGAWRATVHRVAKSRTRLKQLSMHPENTESKPLIALQPEFYGLLQREKKQEGVKTEKL